MGGTDGLFFEAAQVVADAREEERAGSGVGADRYGAEMISYPGTIVQQCIQVHTGYDGNSLDSY